MIKCGTAQMFRLFLGLRTGLMFSSDGAIRLKVWKSSTYGLDK